LKSRILLAAPVRESLCTPAWRTTWISTVYRIGGRIWLEGGNLYGTLPPTAMGVRMPFTYTPLAAIILSPLSLIPLRVAGIVMDLGIVAVLALALRPYCRRLGWKLSWVLPAALLLEPVRGNLAYGQVDVFLMAMVIADCLTDSPRWPRGSLAGLAAAMKLTPALFIVFFLLRRDYRAAATMGRFFRRGHRAGIPAGSRGLDALLDDYGVRCRQDRLIAECEQPEHLRGSRPCRSPSGYDAIHLPLAGHIGAGPRGGLRRHALRAGGRRCLPGADSQCLRHFARVADLMVTSLGLGTAGTAVPGHQRPAARGYRLRPFRGRAAVLAAPGRRQGTGLGPVAADCGDSYVLCAIAVVGWFAYRALAANLSLSGRLAPMPFPSAAPLAYPPDDVAAASSHSRSYPAYSPTGAHITAGDST